ncbi:MAG: HAMP domain-containing histidine kinase [Clostridia bacterium]|nr:HAMP domain-containing histidine kinase [Clostridia bacterium]
MIKEGLKRIEQDFVLKHSSLCIILIYNFVSIIIGYAFYYLLPLLMGYAPNFMESSAAIGPSYTTQYVIIASLAFAVGTIFFVIAFRGISGWKSLLEDRKVNAKKIQGIRRKCINLPYIIFLSQILLINVPLAIVLFLVTAVTKAPVIMEVRIITIIFSFFSLAAVVSHTFSKKIFTKILLNTYHNEELEGRRIKLVSKIFLQILPMFIVAILLTGVLGYSRLMEEKGDMIYNDCRNQLINNFKDIKEVRNANEIFKILSNIKINNENISYFVIHPDGRIETSNGKTLTKTYEYNTKNPIQGDRVYGDTNEEQGIVMKIKGAAGIFIAGVKFDMASEKTVNFFLLGLTALLLLNIMILFYFSRSLSGEISLVAESLTEIAEGEHVDLDRKLAVVSNDELGDLVIAFNKIQEREKEHIKTIEENTSILMEQERLASLGQLIGGIAHNLRSPIMSLSGAIEGLKDLAMEYDSSIEDENVTKEDHHQIAKEMLDWLEKMKPYCAYMSDIITAVKEQTVQPSAERGLSFTVDEIVKRVDILMNHELKKYHCKLNTRLEVDRNTVINGEVSILVQVLNNLIINAIEAYEGRGGAIDFGIVGSENRIDFIIRDYGKGMSPEVQEKLFKEMITTKGKKGTGLGLYMSSSNIKARFKGKLCFFSEEGKGTEFHVEIPIT